jgi:thioredoxin-related protein
MQKKIFLFLAFTFLSFGQNINWNLDFKQARNIAIKNNKILMIFVTQKWCGACNYMEKHTLKNNEVVSELQKYFIPIKLNIKKLPPKTYIRGTPSFLFYKPNGRRIKYRIIGRYKKSTFLYKIQKLRKALIQS